MMTENWAFFQRILLNEIIFDGQFKLCDTIKFKAFIKDIR